MPREFKRVLLKLSGEALREPGSQDNISQKILEDIALQIKAAREKRHLEIALVVGGGNFWRGLPAANRGMDRSTADHVGMLATVMNSLALMASLEDVGVETRVLTAIEMKEVAEPFILRRATRHLERGRVVIFGAGIGSPFFSTDTTAALRANEIEADVIFKGTKVDGIYTADPKTNPGARRFRNVSFEDCKNLNLKVMDGTAFTLCAENDLPIIVFDMMPPGNITRALTSTEIGTVVNSEPSRYS